MYSFRDRRAVLLDDNPSNRMLLEFALAIGQIEFEVVETIEALSAIWQPDYYAFAFLNLDVFHKAEAGLQIAEQLRHADDQMGLVVFSINDDPHILDAAAQMGCDLYLGMPFQLDLVMTLMKVLDAANLRALPRMLIINDRSRPSWVSRTP